jgi:GDPmannose 4,6-dehydratase
MALGLQDTLYLGNLNAKRDWGHARDFVEAQWLMLQQEEPQDFVIATGQQYSVRAFCEKAFDCLGVQIEWRGEGIDEIGVISMVRDRELFLMPVGHVAIRIDPGYFRPTEVETLLGDATKARRLLGWSPKTTFEELVDEMVMEDSKLARFEQIKHHHGLLTQS